MRWLPYALLLASCVGYRPGSFASGGREFADARVTIDCVDVAAAAVEMPAPEWLAVEFVIANGCESERVIDFGAVRLTTEHGGRLGPLDPRREIRPATLEARTVARVTARFADDDTQRGTTTIARGQRLCFDLGGLVSVTSGRSDGALCIEPRHRVAEVIR